MSIYRFHPRPHRPSAAALHSLDLGLRVRIDTRCPQRSIFHGAEDLPVKALVSELVEMVASLRVRSFRLRADLEEVASALMVNVDSGFATLAQRAALDLGGLLQTVGQRRLADPELSVRGAKAAYRVADLLGREVR